jgi:hypothetical protein
LRELLRSSQSIKKRSSCSILLWLIIVPEKEKLGISKKGEIRVKDRKKSGYKRVAKLTSLVRQIFQEQKPCRKKAPLAHPSERRYSRKAIHRDVSSSCLGLALQNSQEEAMKWSRFLPEKLWHHLCPGHHQPQWLQKQQKQDQPKLDPPLE